MADARVTVDSEKLQTFCREHHIRKLALFGSVLRDDFRVDSDVDVLVEFEEKAEPGFIRLAAMERELTALVGRQVDLRTPEDLSPLFRDEVTGEAKVLYAA
ncbi:MAG TPA: nucleotidyltransferase domain-containing protein [Candidatus Hydrogenedentes bacterium]|nr:nucleotidyltransferase domain-containing protein [Candidatus Hydrogenedentota bacterium]